MKKVFLFLIIGTNWIQAQQIKLSEANKNYDNYAYIKAIDIYEKVVKKGYKSAELFEKLANSYYLNGEYKKAAEYFESLFSMGKPSNNEAYFKYSHCLKTLNKYREADEMMSLYINVISKRSEKDKLKNYLNEIKENSKNYIIKPTTISTHFSDYSPVYYNNCIYFTSAMDSASVVRLNHDWTGQNYTDIYIAKINKDTSLTYVGNFSKKINTKYNESSAIFTKDGKIIYFTRNNFLNGKKGKSSNKSTFVKIYKATLQDGEWQNITELPFNTNEASFAHPTLSPDEKTLYFASDMNGTHGHSDIYSVTINTDGSLGTPVNLGKTINTNGRESFPSIDSNGNLYFASDGHLGLGGLDLFVAKIKPDGSFEKPINLGDKMNTPFDDFGITFIDLSTGFFSSNREGGKGSDDIYFFKEIRCTKKISGILYDSTTNEPLNSTEISLLDNNRNEFTIITTDENGFYEFSIDCNNLYFLKIQKKDFESVEIELDSKVEKEQFNLFLNKEKIPLEVGTDLGKIFNISNIRFDLNKWNIRPEAEIQIQKIIEVLKQYPKMTIDIRSHTDSRQTHQYNEILSQKRAQSTLEYMVRNGINKERLTAKGYGETQLLNNCVDGVKCSEEEHQQNRRSEFIITKVE